MKIYNFTSPQGQKLSVNSPDGSVPSEQQLDQMFSMSNKSPKQSAMESNKTNPAMQGGANAPALVQDRNKVKSLTGQNEALDVLPSVAKGLQNTSWPVSALYPKGASEYHPTTGGGKMIEDTGALANPLTGEAFALGGKVLKGAGNILGKIPIGKTGMNVGDITGQASKSMKDAAAKVFKDATNKFVEAIKPAMGKFKQKWQIDKYSKDAGTVVKDIIDNKQDYKFENPHTGQLENRLPQSRWETLNTALNNKKKIWNGVQGALRESTAQGARVDYDKIARDVIDPLLKNKQIQTHEPNLIPQLISLRDKIISTQGKVTPTEAQEELTYLNSMLSTYYKNPSMQDLSLSTVRAALSKRLRDATDKTIEDTLSQGGYKEELSKYSSYKNLEDDLVKGAARQATGKGNKSFLDPVTDAWASGEIAAGLLFGHPAMVVKGAGMAAVKGFVRHFFQDPDVGITNAFKSAERAHGRLYPRQVVNNLGDMKPAIEGEPTVTRKPTTEKPTLSLPSPSTVSKPSYIQEREAQEMSSLGTKRPPGTESPFYTKGSKKLEDVRSSAARYQRPQGQVIDLRNLKKPEPEKGIGYLQKQASKAKTMREFVEGQNPKTARERSKLIKIYKESKK